MVKVNGRCTPLHPAAPDVSVMILDLAEAVMAGLVPAIHVFVLQRH
jgi:hypothetical protein